MYLIDYPNIKSARYYILHAGVLSQTDEFMKRKDLFGDKLHRGM